MANVDIDVQVENVDDVLDTYTTLRLYRDTDPGGDFTSGGVIDTATLVTGTIDYTLTDPNGSAGYIYRYTFYNATGPVESSLSDAYFPTGRYAKDIIIAAAKRAGGFEGEGTSTGTPTTVVDSYLAENGLDEDYCDGTWIFRPDATDADLVRRTVRNPYDSSGPSLEVVVPWGVAPASAERYAVIPLMPPLAGRGGYSWIEALSDALAELRVPDRVDLGVGTSASPPKHRFSLNPHVGYVEKNLVKKVRIRTYYSSSDLTAYDEWDASKNQRWWEYVANGRDDVHLRLEPPPSTDEHVIVDVQRKFERVYRDDDITLCPFDLAVWACLVKVYEHMNRVSGGRYKTELELANSALAGEYKITRPLVAIKQ